MAEIKDIIEGIDDMPSSNIDENKESDIRIVNINEDSKNGQSKCPKCGATDISFNLKTGLLHCEFCRYEFKEKLIEVLEDDLTKLDGQIFTSGVIDIKDDSKDIMTFKCSSCGAEVVVDTNESLQSRCHWCRNLLSINQQIENGAVPDAILPFSIEKEAARDTIEKFVHKRKFFANTNFKKEFNTENIMGVYFPYLVVDFNAHAFLEGQGEVQTREYRVKTGDNSYTTYYDADVYDVKRDFDIIIDDLTFESSADKLDKKSNKKTNNVINAIMPFDTKNLVKWDANYLKGFTSEKRDINVDSVRMMVEHQAKDIARHTANDTLSKYDRGVAWKNETLEVKGQQWSAAYLPVWLYSYQEKKGNKSLLHYVAVNGRTKEVMGSVPIHMPKLLLASLFAQIIGVVFFLLLFLADFDYAFICLFSGLVYFLIVKGQYRNKNARHTHEKETNAEMSNLESYDRYITSRTRLSSNKIMGLNNEHIHGVDSSLLDNLIDSNSIASAIKGTIDKNL